MQVVFIRLECTEETSHEEIAHALSLNLYTGNITISTDIEGLSGSTTRGPMLPDQLD